MEGEAPLPLLLPSDLDALLRGLEENVAAYAIVVRALGKVAADETRSSHKNVLLLPSSSTATADDLERERRSLKQSFIVRKQAIRGLLSLLPSTPDDADVGVRSSRFRRICGDFRAYDGSHKMYRVCGGPNTGVGDGAGVVDPLDGAECGGGEEAAPLDSKTGHVSPHRRTLRDRATVALALTIALSILAVVVYEVTGNIRRRGGAGAGGTG
jgi:hypothetical protein